MQPDMLLPEGLVSLIREDPISCRSSFSWPTLCSYRAEHPTESACLQGPQTNFSLPVVSKRVPPLLLLLPDSEGQAQPQADSEAPRQL